MISDRISAAGVGTVYRLRRRKSSLKAQCFVGRSFLTYNQGGSAATLGSCPLRDSGLQLLTSWALPSYTGGHLGHCGRGIPSVDGPTRGSVARSGDGVCYLCAQPTGPNLTAMEAENMFFEIQEDANEMEFDEVDRKEGAGASRRQEVGHASQVRWADPRSHLNPLPGTLT